MDNHFSDIIDRRNTHSYKWDQSKKLFGSEDILPLWVADMDFASPLAVREAIQQRAAQGIYGYTIRSEAYVQAIVNWFHRRHHWDIQPEWLTDSPGIVTSLSLAVELFSNPEDAVIVQTPVYYPFYDVIRMNNRKIVRNPLQIHNGRYEMDYVQLEKLMQDGAKLMLICSPHNPGGRVWERDELLKLAELCQRYDVMVVSDEIHGDLILPGYQHMPFASLSEDCANRTLTCLAPTKTFNLPGLHTSFIVASNNEIKQKFDYRLKALSLHMTNFFTPDAVRTAYEEGETWLDELLAYVNSNVEFAMAYFAEHLPEIKVMKPEGTYMLWIDCRALGLDPSGLKQLMFEKAKIAFNEGSMFGEEGQGFLRVNLACPRSMVEEALNRFRRAIRE